MPRPRTATDAEILEALTRAISRVGPSRLTLTDVGREVGLSPATLLQRFGSKRGLLLALAEQGPRLIDACFAAVRRARPSPLDALRAAATEMARLVESPEALANHLAFLQIDLSDPEFHRLTLAGARRTRRGYEALLHEAIAVGELAPCDVGPLARAIQAMTGGSLINWAIYREGAVVDWVSADLDVLLAPYRREATTASVLPERAAPRARHNARPSSGLAPLSPRPAPASGAEPDGGQPVHPRRRAATGPE